MLAFVLSVVNQLLLLRNKRRLPRLRGAIYHGLGVTTIDRSIDLSLE